MIVDIMKASEKLESAIKHIKDRCDSLESYNAEYFNLVDIKRDLEQVELYIEDMKMEKLMNDAEEELAYVRELKCIRCGHGWVPRKEILPGTCPKCKSPYWNQPRRRPATVQKIEGLSSVERREKK